MGGRPAERSREEPAAGAGLRRILVLAECRLPLPSCPPNFEAEGAVLAQALVSLLTKLFGACDEYATLVELARRHAGVDRDQHRESYPGDVITLNRALSKLRDMPATQDARRKMSALLRPQG